MFKALKFRLHQHAVVLTPEGASIGETEVVFKARQPLVALNAGVHVSIDVTSLVLVTHPEETLRRIEVTFPLGSIRAVGLLPDGSTKRLTNQVAACSATAAFVHLLQDIGASCEITFSSIAISACCPIPRPSVTWYTYGK